VPVLPAYLTDIKQLGTLIAGTATVVGIVGAVVVMLSRRTVDLAVKLLGSFFVVAICFAAQNGVVYSIGVFVIATLVTELQFLEKLAALVWNRKEYWDYLGKASKSEIERKVAEEEKHRQQVADEEKGSVAAKGASASAPSLQPDNAASAKAVVSGIHFHRAVTRALSELLPLPAQSVRGDVKIHLAGRTFLVDAIINTAIATYVVEIKAGYSARLIKDAVQHVRRQIDEFGDFLLGTRRDSAILRGLIVIPPAPDAPLVVEDMPLLQFNPIKRVFLNDKEVRNILGE
jgi:hypothetical protein